MTLKQNNLSRKKGYLQKTGLRCKLYERSIVDPTPISISQSLHRTIFEATCLMADSASYECKQANGGRVDNC